MSTGTDLAEASLRCRAGFEARDRDPLAWFKWAVPRLKQGFALFTADDPIDELHARGPNKTGKTLTKAAFVIACLQKRSHLDGVAIPQWRGPIEAIQLVLDYPQQLLSVKPAYLKLLGKWPKHVRNNGDYLHSIHIMPIGGDPRDMADWSVIYFQSQKNVDTGRGARADLVDFDEPPDIFFLNELRKAGHAGRRSIRIIGETPEKRIEWAPLREDYGDTPRRTLRRVDQDRAEVRWSLEEVESWVLSDAEKAQMRRSYARDPLKDAREHGDYTNTEGACPFDVDTLIRMLGDCVEPRMQTCRVSREATEEGETATVVKVEVEVYADSEPDASYYIPIDPSAGIDDSKHNPACLHVRKVGSGDLTVRWNGYLAPYSLGVLAAGLARQYNNAAIDIEMKDHWGVNVVRGVQASAYGNLCYEVRQLKPGEWAKEVGFDMNEEARAEVIGGVQEWIESYRIGIKYAHTPCRKVIECILDTELDERGKIVAVPGIDHAEDLVCQGRGIKRAVRRSSRDIPETYTPPRTKEQKLIALIRGEEPDDNEERFEIGRARRAPRV